MSAKRRKATQGTPLDYSVAPASFTTKELAVNPDVSVSTVGGFRMLPNPDIVLRKMGKSIAIYRELETDPQVKAALFNRWSRTLRLKWWVNTEEAEGAGGSVIEALFKRLPIRAINEQALNANTYGFQVFEVLREERDGYILPSRVLPRKQEYFSFDDRGNLMYRDRANGWTMARRYDGTPDEEIIAAGEPLRQFIVARNRATPDNPYGDALLSACFWPVAMKRGGIDFFSRCVEKYGMSWVIGEMPEFAGTEEQRKVKAEEYMALLDQMIEDAVLVLEKGSTMRIESGTNAASVDMYERYLAYMDEQLSKVLLGHSKGLDATPGELGSNGNAADNIDSITSADKTGVEDLYQQLIDDVNWFNFGDPAPPRIEGYRDGDINMAMAARDAILAKELGVKFNEDYVENIYGIPKKYFTIAFVAAPPAGTVQGFSAPNPNPDHAPDQIAVDAVASSFSADELQRMVEMALGPVTDFLAGQSDYAAAINGLAKAFPKMNTSALQQVIRKAIALSHIVGRLAVEAEVG